MTLTKIKLTLGINILELASMLQVSRPAIFEWTESKKITIDEKTQERVTRIYKISEEWKAKGVGRLGSYLHRPIGILNVSLFDLLKSDDLNLTEIDHHLNTIARAMLKKRKKDEAHEALLRKHGFEAVSKEDMDDRLIDIDFLDW